MLLNWSMGSLCVYGLSSIEDKRGLILCREGHCSKPIGSLFINSMLISRDEKIECFHSFGQHICKFIGTKESVCIRKEFNSHRTGLGHQHGRRFIVLEQQYGRRDVMWKHSIGQPIHLLHYTRLLHVSNVGKLTFSGQNTSLIMSALVTTSCIK